MKAAPPNVGNCRHAQATEDARRVVTAEQDRSDVDHVLIHETFPVKRGGHCWPAFHKHGKNAISAKLLQDVFNRA